ncbi:hypothetical protein J1N35_025266 [Gossypium stocksii]|uniref:Uncharacterized protein n=1 Tax=Gossypium stocksii TaxID=47602 RepID=A0A9D3V7C6_9ROSI|nr:hypothetical protein J1N35_025266 [Gossypium stocksii]
MQAKVEKEMCAVQDSSSASTSQAEKEEVDSRSIYVGDLVVELGLDLFAVNDEKFMDMFVSAAAIEVLQHKRQSLQNCQKMMKQRHKVEREANIMPKLDGRRIRKLQRLIQSLQP